MPPPRVSPERLGFVRVIKRHLHRVPECALILFLKACEWLRICQRCLRVLLIGIPVYHAEVTAIIDASLRLNAANAFVPENWNGLADLRDEPFLTQAVNTYRGILIALAGRLKTCANGPVIWPWQHNARVCGLQVPARLFFGM
jgi:hypothetical protein